MNKVLISGMFTIQESQSQRFPRQVGPSTSEVGDTLQIVLLGDEVSFDCSVESEDVSEVSIWWQKDGVNLTSVRLKNQQFLQKGFLRMRKVQYEMMQKVRYKRS